MELGRAKLRVMHLELNSEHIQRQGANHSKAVGCKIESIALVDSQLTGRNCHNSAVLLIKKKKKCKQRTVASEKHVCIVRSLLHCSALIRAVAESWGRLCSPQSNGIERMWREFRAKASSHSVSSKEGLKDLG